MPRRHEKSSTCENPSESSSSSSCSSSSSASDCDVTQTKSSHEESKRCRHKKDKKQNKKHRARRHERKEKCDKGPCGCGSLSSTVTLTPGVTPPLALGQPGVFSIGPCTTSSTGAATGVITTGGQPIFNQAGPFNGTVQPVPNTCIGPYTALAVSKPGQVRVFASLTVNAFADVIGTAGAPTLFAEIVFVPAAQSGCCAPAVVVSATGPTAITTTPFTNATFNLGPVCFNAPSPGQLEVRFCTTATTITEPIALGLLIAPSTFAVEEKKCTKKRGCGGCFPSAFSSLPSTTAFSSMPFGMGCSPCSTGMFSRF